LDIFIFDILANWEWFELQSFAVWLIHLSHHQFSLLFDEEVDVFKNSYSMFPHRHGQPTRAVRELSG